MNRSKNQQQVPGGQINPLLGRFDLDPGRWRPLFYKTEVEIGINAGDQGVNTITINNQPYILTRLTHGIIGPVQDSQTGYYQDGMYDIEWKDEQSNYQNTAIPADLMFGSSGGSVGNGFSLPLPYPIPYSGNKTLTFRLTNRVNRVFDPEANIFKVAIVLHGIADWGQLT